MRMTEELYLTSRADWREWLEKNHANKNEVWLIYYKTHTGKPSISYDDAVEEALCFGWVDSIIKKLMTRSLLENSLLDRTKANGLKLTRREP